MTREATIRPEWLFEITNYVQGQVLPPCLAVLPSVAQGVPDGLLNPTSPFEMEVFAALQTNIERGCCRHLARPADRTAPEELIEARGQDRVSNAVRRAAEILDEEYTGSWTLYQLARRVACNRTQLEQGFESLFSCTYRTYLNRRRIAASKVILATSQWRIEEIGRAVGYSSKGSFYPNFERLVGMTPEEYRRRWQPAPARTVLELLKLNPHCQI